MSMITNLTPIKRPQLSRPLAFAGLLVSAICFHNFVNTLGLSQSSDDPLNQHIRALSAEGDDSNSKLDKRSMDAIPQNETGIHSGAAFVCITGQLQRLELHHKVKTVLNPLREAGYEPYIALMLTDNNETLHYTNLGNHLGQAFDDFSQARAFLKGQGFHVTNKRAIVQPEDPVLNPEYSEIVGRYHGVRRVKNHARQFHTMVQCGDEMTKDGRNYEFAIRLREDVGMTDPLRVTELHEQLFSQGNSNKRRILSSWCRRHEGMNDRMAMVTPEAAHDYFYAPFINWYSRPLHRRVRNVETYLRTTYRSLGMHIIDSKILQFVVKLEPTTDGSFVLMLNEDHAYCIGGDQLPDHILNDTIATQFLKKHKKRRKKKKRRAQIESS